MKTELEYKKLAQAIVNSDSFKKDTERFKIILKHMDTTIEDLERFNRDQLIAWLRWNDPNGIYTDEDSEREGFDPITLDEAKEIAIRQKTENLY